MRSAAARALRLAGSALAPAGPAPVGAAWRAPTAAAAAASSSSSSFLHRPFACNAGLGRPPPPEVIICYGADRLDEFIAAADELEEAFPGLVVTGVDAGDAAPATAFEVAPPRPARPGGEEADVYSPAAPTLWSGLASGRPPRVGEVAALLAAAGASTSSSSPYAPLAAALTLQDPADPLVTVGPTPRGRGLITTRPAPSGAVLISVDTACALVLADETPVPPGSPAATALAEWAALHEPAIPPLLASYILTAPDNWFARAVAWLLWATRHGPPAWRAYGAGVLPGLADLSSLMTFSDAEAEELLGVAPALVAAVAAERAAIAGLHARLFSSTTGSLAALDLAPALADTLRAAACVNSRSFADVLEWQAGEEEGVGGEGGRGRVLYQALSLFVPCVDLANHDADAPNAAFGFIKGESAFGLTSVRALEAGEEVTISYTGDGAGGGGRGGVASSSSSSSSAAALKGSTRMLRDYGFVPPGNVADRLAPLAASAADAEALKVGGAAWERAAAKAAAASVAAAAADASPEVRAAGRRATAALASLADAVASPVGGGGGAGTAAAAGGRLPTPKAQAAALEVEAARRAAECEALANGSSSGISPVRAAAAAGWWAERAALAGAVLALLEE